MARSRVLLSLTVFLVLLSGSFTVGVVQSEAVPTTDCYQEDATLGNGCGAVAGGSYSSTGAWTDGTWDGQYTTVNGTGVYVTYKKPVGATGAKHKAKLYMWNNSSLEQEDAIPQGCWNAGNEVKLWIHQSFQDPRCGDYMAYGGQYCLYVDCFDGTSWVNEVTGTGSVNSGSHFNTVYEEGMTWTIDATPVGYNPQWLITTLVSLMGAGGYLLRRRTARR